MASPRVVTIIQARMGSTRLPGKVLSDLEGAPMLRRVVERAQRAPHVDAVVVATTTSTLDDPVAAFCAEAGIDCFRGSEDDVLDRYYQAAKAYGADVVARVTADCPLLDPAVVGRVVGVFLAGGHDYVSNTIRYTYPDGLDTEVFTFAALKTAWKEARLPAEREHVTPYLRTHPQFRRSNVEHSRDLSPQNLRWTVDEPADLAFVRAVYARLGANGDDFGLEDVLRLLEEEPSLLKMNEGLIRNEGYYKSLAKEPPVPPLSRKLERSLALKAEADGLIPSCTQTFSKGPTQFVQGVAPVFLSHGAGSHVWDVDGNEYIDFPMGLGPVLLGHDFAHVTEAVVARAKAGTAFSLPHPLEVEVSRMLTEIVPGAEMVRFGKNGSDATAGAVRAARAYTGRDVIACCGYHGWQDWYIGTTTRAKGVPQAVRELTKPFAYNDLASLEAIFAAHPGGVAAVIMEPIGVVPPAPGFLEAVKALAHREGALLIFDEVITGCRLALGGAAEHFGVTPDMACLGKGLANGYPLSAIAGRRDVMMVLDEAFFSFTFGGDALALAAAKATLETLRSEPVIPHLWEQGQKLQDGFTVLAAEFGLAERASCQGLPPRTVVSFKEADGSESLLLKSLFQQECLKRGVLFSGGQFLCYSHSDEDIERTLRVYRAALEILAAAIAAGDVAGRLEGPPVQAVFRKA